MRCTLLVIAHLLLAAPAFGYVVEKAQGTGVELRWTSLPMKFNIHQAAAKGVTAADTQAAVRAAYKAWADVTCSYFATQDLGVVNLPTGNENDSINTHVWRATWPSSYGSNALGITTTYYDPGSGKILDADTHYNPNYTWAVNGSPSAIDVQSVATHEIGHQLGLDHSPYQDATMFYATGAGNTGQRSLHSDDIAGVCYLYPSGSPPPPECTTAAQCAPNETCQNNKCVGAVAKGYGSPCDSGQDCQSGICLQYATNTFCSIMCDSQPCPSGDKCLPLQGGGSACLPGSSTMGTKLLGEPCQTDLDCKSDICVSVPGSGYLCSQPCTLTPDNCPTSYYCANSSIGGLCIPGDKPVVPPPPVKKGLGEPCASAVDCQSNICASTPAGMVCIRWCNDTDNFCPDGFICVPAGAMKACIRDPAKPPPTKGALGTVCTDNADCTSNICGADASGNRFCTELCDPAAGCSVAGFDCVPAGGDKYACTPTTATGGGGGCAVGGSPDGRWLLLIFALPLVLLRRRRRA